MIYFRIKISRNKIWAKLTNLVKNKAMAKLYIDVFDYKINDIEYNIDSKEFRDAVDKEVMWDILKGQ